MSFTQKKSCEDTDLGREICLSVLLRAILIYTQPGSNQPFSVSETLTEPIMKTQRNKLTSHRTLRFSSENKND
ncbi:hypothetical protein SAMN03080617_02911 [Algoriphagus alkaliphilus]|uniref:Uncharacterized protein n=1 Tax=Algoriphagus alkaliphilus TaxID=279824 RepID=A0A1G5YW93_9BACT|nr:hypothetical protein SAMN03080617_02911 [Algoriphagus alkaliphilus]